MVALKLFSCSLFWLKHVKNLYTTVLYIFKRFVKLLRVVISLDDVVLKFFFLKSLELDLVNHLGLSISLILFGL